MLEVRHSLLADIVQTVTKLKLMMCPPIHGMKWPIIHTRIRKYQFLIKYLFVTNFWSIYRFSTVTTWQGALIIGGTTISTVACYNEKGWNKLDNLQSTRTGHRSIVNGDKVYVIGGNGTRYVKGFCWVRVLKIMFLDTLKFGVLMESQKLLSWLSLSLITIHTLSCSLLTPNSVWSHEIKVS